jgi:hypothetical protein
MTIDSILAQIDSEIARLTQVRALLSGNEKSSVADTKSKGVAAGAPAKGTRKKRVLSPEARKRIADAQRKRWAAQRAKAKTK